ncbi:MAG TPA: hypothetical protein VGJ60_24285 [Chloroflexota bacterium]|jgi:hypothetical protein
MKATFNVRLEIVVDDDHEAAVRDLERCIENPDYAAEAIATALGGPPFKVRRVRLRDHD